MFRIYLPYFFKGGIFKDQRGHILCMVVQLPDRSLGGLFFAFKGIRE